jgi:hypothetical protein
MELFSKLKNLFRFSVNGKSGKKSAEGQNVPFDVLYDDLGIFSYTDDGFTITLNEAPCFIKWSAIERITTYKRDLMTYDLVCMEITYDNRMFTIHEESLGWYQFIKRTKAVFPEIPESWDVDIVLPSFETNWKALYQRADRVLTLYNNFYADFSGVTATVVKELLVQHGWRVRTSSSTEVELVCSWAELMLQESGNEPLLSGIVAFHEDNLALLDNIFSQSGGGYRYEFYDEEHQLILEKKTTG